MVAPTKSHLSFLPSILIVGVLCLGAAAAAAPQPVLYWLKDGATGPVGDGSLLAYDPLHPNVPNGTQPHSRLIIAGADAVAPVRFLTPSGEAHPDRLKGPLLVGLWLGPSSVYKGNLTATLYEVSGTTPHALAHASVMLDTDLNKTPNATKLIPPPPAPPSPPNPADPQAVNETQAYAEAQATSIVFYEAAQALPLLIKPPAVFYMGVVDIPFNATSQFAIGFSLTQGSSSLPVAMGGFGHVQYDYLLGPSYVYVPWYKTDPVKPVTTTTSHPTSASTSADSHTDSTASQTTTHKKSPATSAIPLVGGLAVLAFALRRRL